MAGTTNREAYQMQNPALEVNASGGGVQEEQSPHSQAAHSLPPCDSGKAAWTLLLAAFIFEALLWGQLNISSVRPTIIR